MRRAYDEVRHALRSPSPRGRRPSLGEQCWFYLRRVTRCLTAWNTPPVVRPRQRRPEAHQPYSCARSDRIAPSRTGHTYQVRNLAPAKVLPSIKTTPHASSGLPTLVVDDQ